MKAVAPYCPYCLDQTEDPPVDLEVMKSLECDCPTCQTNPWMDMTPACHTTDLFHAQFCPVHDIIILVCAQCRAVAFTLAVADRFYGFSIRAKRRPAAPDKKADPEPTPRPDPPGGRAA